MRKITNGERFGRWTVVNDATPKKPHKRVLCRCDCGTERPVTIHSLLKGMSTSCGCNRSRGGLKFIHPRLYAVWNGFKQRCVNPKNPRFNDYGGRGIQVCEDWTLFRGFLKWALANGYDENLTIDRIDYDGNYEPENCRWATAEEQQNNRRTNHRLKFYNSDFTIAEWAGIIGVSYACLFSRINRGWSTRRALTTRVQMYEKRML